MSLWCIVGFEYILIIDYATVMDVLNLNLIVNNQIWKTILRRYDVSVSVFKDILLFIYISISNRED